MKRVNFERQYWNQKAESKNVDSEMHDKEISTEEEIDILFKDLDFAPKAILEIGCGVGRLAIPTALKFSQANVLGIDISEGLLNIAKNRAKNIEASVNNLGFQHTKGRKLPNDYQSDFIYAVTVFQHIDEGGIKAYISEVGKHLNKNGVFRFQFIEGNEHEPMSHHYQLDEVSKWLNMNDLVITKYDKGLIYQNWTWVTAKKL